MIVLRATLEQYQALQGWTNGLDVLEFGTDANGDYILSTRVLDDPAFADIYDQLSALEQIEFVRPPEDI